MPLTFRGRGSPDADRGAVALVVAALMVVFLGLAALVVDLGFARDRVRVAQNAADAAALAVATCFASATSGCNSVPAATAKAQEYITANGWTFDASTVSIDTTAQTATIGLPAEQSPSFFAGAIGFGSPSVAGRARATWNNSGPVTCVLCVLQDFQGQAADITLGGGLAVGDDLTFNAGEGSVTVNGSGGVSFGGSWDGHGTFTMNGAPTTPVQLGASLTDPYAGLALPVVAFGTRAVIGSGACDPGVYTDLSGCTSLTGGGTYVVTGNGVSETPVTIPGGDIPNTLIYFTCGRRSFFSGTVGSRPCSPTRRGAHLAGTGNGNATLHGLSSGPNQGFAIIYDPGRTVNQTLTGSGSLVVDGNVYGRTTLMDFRGDGSASITVAGTLVARGVTLNGGGTQNQQLAVPGGGSPETVAPGRPIHLIP